MSLQDYLLNHAFVYSDQQGKHNLLDQVPNKERHIESIMREVNQHINPPAKAQACIDTITQLKIMASTELAVKNNHDAQVIHDWIESKGAEFINALEKK